MPLTLQRAYRPSFSGVGVIQVVGDGGQLLLMDSLTETTVVVSGVPVQETAIQVPAGAVVLGVCTKVAVQPGGTTTMSVRGAHNGHQFNVDDVSTVAGSVDPGSNGCPVFNGQAQPISYTFDADPTDALGRITTTLFYYTVTP